MITIDPSLFAPLFFFCFTSLRRESFALNNFWIGVCLFTDGNQFLQLCHSAIAHNHATNDRPGRVFSGSLYPFRHGEDCLNLVSAAQLFETTAADQGITLGYRAMDRIEITVFVRNGKCHVLTAQNVSLSVSGATPKCRYNCGIVISLLRSY